MESIKAKLVFPLANASLPSRLSGPDIKKKSINWSAECRLSVQGLGAKPDDFWSN